MREITHPGITYPWAATAAAAALCGPGLAQAAPDPATALAEAVFAGKPILEVRARYEDVDQTGFAVDAQAITVRTRLGWETGSWNHLKALVELETVGHLGPEHFAVNVPGAATPPLNGPAKALYPIVNDPDVTELNRAQLTWTPSAMFSATAGRQRIVIDDQRFVGNVGWRQDEQTFDGARVDLALGPVKATYAYLGRVNRTLGDLKDWRSDSHLLNAAWTPAEALRLEAFVYALDFSSSTANASITKGVRASGKAKFGAYGLAYDATFSNQTDWRGRTAPFDLDYRAASATGTFDIWSARLGYESLEGDGKRGFTTPLATTHGFQGWADAWVSPGGAKSFVDGIVDSNLTLGAKPALGQPPAKGKAPRRLDLLARYHDFEDQRTGAALAHEWDLQAATAITPRLSVALKYADFRREGSVPVGTATPPASRTKLWLTFEYKL